MSKPDWKEIPEWVEWTAQDADGTWYGYDLQPQVVGDQFCRPDLNQLSAGRFITLDRGDPRRDWRGTLEQRPAASGGAR